MTTPITMKFDGKVYHLATQGVTKATAMKKAKYLRRQWGSLARVVKVAHGKYNVYSYPQGISA